MPVLNLFQERLQTVSYFNASRFCYLAERWAEPTLPGLQKNCLKGKSSMENNNPGNNQDSKQALVGKDAYKFAYDTRNFEISLFWQRSNYFLVLNTAIALAFFS